MAGINRRAVLLTSAGALLDSTLRTSALSTECKIATPPRRDDFTATRTQTSGQESFTFNTIEPEDLSDLAVVPQCLDNQWVPTALLHRIINTRRSRSEMVSELQGYIRSEYVRSLINSEQVIVNRAFLENNV